MAKKQLSDAELLASMGFNKTHFIFNSTDTYKEHLNKYLQRQRNPINMEAWDPMKDDFTNRQFNSYDRGPGKNLPKERFKNMGGEDRNIVELYITGIPQELTEEGLRNLFCQCGEVVKARKLESTNPEFMGTYGFIGYNTVNEATAAIAKLDQKTFIGGKYKLKVKFAMTSEEKRERTRQKEVIVLVHCPNIKVKAF